VIRVENTEANPISFKIDLLKESAVMIMNCASAFKFRSLIFNFPFIVAEKFVQGTLNSCEKRVNNYSIFITILMNLDRKRARCASPPPDFPVRD